MEITENYQRFFVLSPYGNMLIPHVSKFWKQQPARAESVHRKKNAKKKQTMANIFFDTLGELKRLAPIDSALNSGKDS